MAAFGRPLNPLAPYSHLSCPITPPSEPKAQPPLGENLNRRDGIKPMLNTDTSRQTILIGEDESEVRGLLEMTLRCQGYQVELAENGDEVLAHLRERRACSAVLLDIMMPNKDGIETLREIRQFDGDLPVVMLSGMATPVKIVEAMKFGATDFLAKPVTHEHL